MASEIESTTSIGYMTCIGSYFNDSRYNRLRLMFDVVPLPLDWPAEVNYHEAKAFCKWKGAEYRLTTEAEQHVLRSLPAFEAKTLETDPIYSADVIKRYNVNLAYGSSTVGFFCQYFDLHVLASGKFGRFFSP